MPIPGVQISVTVPPYDPVIYIPGHRVPFVRQGADGYPSISMLPMAVEELRATIVMYEYQHPRPVLIQQNNGMAVRSLEFRLHWFRIDQRFAATPVYFEGEYELTWDQLQESGQHASNFFGTHRGIQAEERAILALVDRESEVMARERARDGGPLPGPAWLDPDGSTEQHPMFMGDFVYADPRIAPVLAAPKHVLPVRTLWQRLMEDD